MAEIDVEIEIKDLIKEIDKLGKAEEHALKQAARAIGGEAAGFAKETCPVDTGLLRNSITFAVSGEETAIKSYKADKAKVEGKQVQSGGYSGQMPKEKSGLAVYIGTNVKYAAIQENGDFQHHTGQSKHFLKNAATQHGPRYKEILEAAFKAADIK